MLHNKDVKEMPIKGIENSEAKKMDDRFSSDKLLSLFILDRLNEKDKNNKK